MGQPHRWWAVLTTPSSGFAAKTQEAETIYSILARRNLD